jgi:hypothetical protein
MFVRHCIWDSTFLGDWEKVLASGIEFGLLSKKTTALEPGTAIRQVDGYLIDLSLLGLFILFPVGEFQQISF